MQRGRSAVPSFRPPSPPGWSLPAPVNQKGFAARPRWRCWRGPPRAAPSGLEQHRHRQRRRRDRSLPSSVLRYIAASSSPAWRSSCRRRTSAGALPRCLRGALVVAGAGDAQAPGRRGAAQDQAEGVRRPSAGGHAEHSAATARPGPRKHHAADRRERRRGGHAIAGAGAGPPRGGRGLRRSDDPRARTLGPPARRGAGRGVLARRVGRQAAIAWGRWQRSALTVESKDEQADPHDLRGVSATPG